MIKGLKRGIVFAIAVFLLAGVAGCGKAAKETSTEIKDFVYTAEFFDIASMLGTEMEYFEAYAANGNNLYIKKSERDESTEKNINYIYNYNLEEKTSESFAVPLYDNANIDKMKLNSQGNLVMLVNSIPETNENGEVIDNASKVELTEVSAADGTVIGSVDITANFEGGYNYTQFMELDSQDNVYIYQNSYDGVSNILLLDKSGKLLGKIPCDNWINAMFTSKEGNVYVLTYGMDSMEIKPIDIASKSFGAAISDKGVIGGNSIFVPGIKNGILASDGRNVYKYDFTTNQKEDVFSWMDIDVNSDGLTALGELEDGRYWGIINEFSFEPGENNTKLVIAKKKSVDSVVQKEEITYGTLWLDSTVKNKIINFNVTNEKYSIKVKEYGAGDDYEASLTQINNELISGTAPDILDVSTLNFVKYANRGIFENIYEYMERDGIKKEDYIASIFKANEVDGKLYVISPRFYIDTAIVKKSKAGDISGWNLSELLAYAEKGAEGSDLLDYSTRNNVFYYCVYSNINEFIDWKEGTCSFNSDEFIKLLEFASKYPEEIDFNQDTERGAASLRSDKSQILQTAISSVRDYQMVNAIAGEEVAFVGYPNSERNGNLMSSSGGCMTINSKSKCKDGAWEFIKMMISDEVQDEIALAPYTWGFPVKVSSLDKRFAKDMEEKAKSDDDTAIVAETVWAYGESNAELAPATEEEIEAIRSLINSAEKTICRADMTLQKIIEEESNVFFAGQKTAEEVADIIQNRIQTYVSEQK